MNLPDGARVESLFPDGVRLILARHRPGITRGLAFFGGFLPLIVMAAGFAVLCFLAAFGVVEGGGENVSRWWFLPFGAFFGTAAIAFSIQELSTFFGHREIELAHGRLKSILRVGPLKWTRQCALREVQRLNVPDSWSAFGRERHGDSLIAELNRGEPAETLRLARHYPQAWLLEVAEWLAEQINRESLRSGDRRVEAVTETTADRLSQATAEQPTESRIRVQALTDGVALRVPPPGLLDYAGGAGAMCGVMGLGTLVVTGVVAFNLDVPAMSAFIVAPALITVIAFGLFVYLWNGARRRTVLVATPERLRVAQSAPFGSREHEWDRDELASLGVGPSRFTVGTKTAKRHLPELQIRPHEGSPLGLFPGRDEGELRWLATLLQSSLGLPATDRRAG